MRRPLAPLGSVAPALVLALGLAAVGAGPARADDLQVLVERTVAVGERIPLTLLSDEPGTVTVSVFRQPDAAALGDPKAGARPGNGPGFSFRYEAAGRRQTVGVPAPAPGPYVLHVAKGGRSTWVTALVSDLALVTKRHPGGLLAWAVHRTTGAPWGGVQVALRTGTTALAEGMTDARGLVRFDRSLPPTVTVEGRAGDHVALGDEVWFPAGSEDLRVYAFPNQPAYRPGERVEVKGVVRGVVDGRYVLPREVATVRLVFVGPGSDGQGPGVEVPLSPDLGTFSGGFDLPADARTGAWRLVAVVERPRAPAKEYEAPFVVEAYRKPSLEVVVTPKAPQVLAGEPATFDVAASFYDGGPVAGASATWSLVWNRVDRDLFPTSELVRLFFATEQEAYEPEVLATGEAKTGPDGRFPVTVTTPAGRPDGYLTLQVVVVGPDRVAVAGSGSVSVAAAPVAVGLRTDRHLYGPEDVARVTVRAETADGRPAASRPGVLLVGVAADGERAEKVLATLPFATDADGLARLDAPLGMSARYVLTAAVERLPTEPAGPPASATLQVYAVGENSTIGYAGERLEVVADREDYAVGDRARLLVLTPAASKPLLASLEGARLLAVDVLAPQGNAALWTVEILEEHVPNVFASFAAVDHGNLLTASRMLRIPPATRRLTATVAPDVAEIRPGAVSGATIRVVDAAGAPVAGAEIALAVVDDALHALHPDPAAPLEAFFYPVRRNDVRTGGPLHHVATGFLAPTPRRERQEERLADGGSGAPGAETGGPPMPAPSTRPPEAPGSPPPADAAAPSGGLALEERESGEEAPSEAKKSKDDGGPGEPAAPRADFRTSVCWIPSVRTDAEGLARVPEIRYADALTRWRLTARVVDADTRVGTSIATVRARLPVSVRVTAPRFLRRDDSATVPLVVRNLTEQAAEIALRFRTRLGDHARETAGSLAVGPGATATSEGSARAEGPGTLVLEATATSAAGSDAERREVPVLPQGIEKVLGRQASLAAGTTPLSLEVPAQAEPGSVSCRVSVEPAYVQAAVSALPYLAGYPYGCTEQTMSRFVPVLAAVEALEGLGIPRRGIAAELPRMVTAGLGRLEALRHEDGGFGWWPADETDPGMTAVVARGLSRVLRLMPQEATAKALRDGALQCLEGLLAEVEDLPTLASVLLALAEAARAPADVFGRSVDAALAPEVSPLTKALYLQAVVAASHDPADLRALADQLVAAVVREDGTAHWAPSLDPEGGIAPTRWQEDPVETTAEVLRALLATRDARHLPLLAEGARWLVLARRGGDHWRSTRDTAAAVAFLAAYAAATGDLGAGRSVEVRLDGRPLGTIAITKENLFTDASVLSVPPDRLAPGARLALELVAASGNATASVALRFHETGPAIAASDAGFRVERRWWRLEPGTQRTEDGEEVVWTRTPVTETVPTGTLLEVEILVTTPREREYAMVVDPHVAGFEPVEETAMEVVGRTEAAEATAEGYDDRTVFFASRLPAGTSTFRHLVRATHVGHYTALPAQASLMYFPDVRGNGAGEAFEIAREGSPTGRGSEGGAR